MSNDNATLILEAVETCLQALQSIPTEVNRNYQAEIEKAEQALVLAHNMAKQEMVEVILGALYVQEYDRDYTLYRVTVEDFADLLADRLVKHGAIPADLTPEELGHLVGTTADFLNGEGMPWADVINIALEDAWPERLKGLAQ